MKNKKRALGTFFVIMCCINVSFALVISEIQFDPAGSDTDREWVEIFNDSQNSEDVTQDKFFENNTNHSISVLSGDKSLGSAEYAVIVQDLNKFKTDYPNYSGKIYKSSFSLSNSGESLSLKDKDGNNYFTVDYTSSASSAGNGFTLNFDGTSFVKGSANPGQGSLQVGQIINNQNINSISTTTDSTTQTATSSGGFTAPVYYYRSYLPDWQTIYVNAGNNKIGMTGAGVIFETVAVTGDKKPVSADTNYFWSFGDGGDAQGKNVMHVYKFPGEYTVDVEAYSNGSKASDRIYVKVIDPELSVFLKESNGERFAEIKNNSKDEVDVGGFQLKTTGGEFEYISTLAKHLSVMPGKSVKISQEVLKFATSSKNIFLTYTNGKEIAKFLTPVATATGKITMLPKQEIATGTLLAVLTRDDFEKVKVNFATTSTTTMQVVKKVTYKKQINNNQLSNNLGTTSNVDSSPVHDNKVIVIKNNPGLFDNVKKYFGI
jgi:hypothetical protein